MFKEATLLINSKKAIAKLKVVDFSHGSVPFENAALAHLRKALPHWGITRVTATEWRKKYQSHTGYQAKPEGDIELVIRYSGTLPESLVERALEQ